MKIFLDTANLDELRKAADWGIVDGVTTNPTLIAKEETQSRSRLPLSAISSTAISAPRSSLLGFQGDGGRRPASGRHSSRSVRGEAPR